MVSYENYSEACIGEEKNGVQDVNTVQWPVRRPLTVFMYLFYSIENRVCTPLPVCATQMAFYLLPAVAMVCLYSILPHKVRARAKRVFTVRAR